MLLRSCFIAKTNHSCCRRTKFKNVVVLLQFPEKYPTAAIIVELKSKTLPPRLLAKMTELCDQEAKKMLGKPQVLFFCT